MTQVIGGRRGASGILMGRRTAAATLLLLTAGRAGIVHACTGDLDELAVAAVVEGWVEGITFRPDLSSGTYDDPAADPFLPVAVSLRVAQFLMGGGGTPLTFFDFTSVSRAAPRRPDGSLGVAPANACGVLDADPTGQYALLILARDGVGRLYATLPLGAAFGPGPGAPDVQRLRLALRDRYRLPASGRPHGGAGALPSWAYGSAPPRRRVGDCSLGLIGVRPPI